ncbi:MAG TPA: hypothetical protein VE170_18390 [Candidatus Limnocylindria bacterium]|jgi:hypothetical protein|nr:hypothetical protein [Candidatus Limnocylindria bacterium]
MAIPDRDDVPGGKTRTRLAAMAASSIRSKIAAALKARPTPVSEDSDNVASHAFVALLKQFFAKDPRFSVRAV